MDRRLAALSIGMFAMGTDNFVVAGILPSVAASLHVSVSLAGQMVTVYALSFALLAVARHVMFEPAHHQRQRDGHDEIEEGDDIVGLEELEGARGIDLAELGDVLDAERRDQRRILDHGDEIVA